MMKKLSAAVLTLALLVSVFAVTAFAAIVEPTDDFYYYDGANVLSDETKGEIFFANERLREETGAEFVIVTIPNTEGQELPLYTYLLFNQWGIGGKNDLGLLLVMSIDDDDYYYMVGTNLEAYLSVDEVGLLKDEYLEPYFAKKQYDAGAKAFFEATFTKLATALEAKVTIADALADYHSYVGDTKDSTASNVSTAANRTQSGNTGSGPKAPSNYNTKRDTGSSGADFLSGLIVLAIIACALFVGVFTRSSFRRNTGYMPPPPPPRGGFGGPRPPRGPSHPPMGGFGGSHPGSTPIGRRTGSPTPFGSSSSRSSSGFGGSSSRSSSGFGGSSRSSSGFGGSSSRSSSGFGGSSRSSGFGGSSRGAGGGRGRR